MRCEIRGTSVDPGGFVVWKQLTGFYERNVGRLRGNLHGTRDPGFRILRRELGGGIVVHQPVVIVVFVNEPAQIQLSEVAQTFEILCSGLGFAQCRQQHARQDGDNGDNHEEFNKRETETGTARGIGT